MNGHWGSGQVSACCSFKLFIYELESMNKQFKWFPACNCFQSAKLEAKNMSSKLLADPINDVLMNVHAQLS